MMDRYLDIFLNNLTPFFANIGLLILTAWAISYFYQKNKRSILNITLQDKIIIGTLLGFVTYLLISSPVKLESGIIMDTRGVPLLISGMIGGPISGVITMIIGLYVRYSFGGAGMIGGLIYIVIFSFAGIFWYKLNQINKFPSPQKLIVITLWITFLTMPVIFTLPEDKQFWALITIWPLMYIANGFGAYVIGAVIAQKLAEINESFEQKRTIEDQKKELLEKNIQILEQSKLIALGDMMGNIAHQWRQPLSVISTAIGNLKLQSDLNNDVTKEDILYTKNLIEKNTDYLSNTIEDFLNFVKRDNVKKELVLQTEIYQAKKILEASLNHSFIKVIDNINYDKPVKIKGIQGELTQVFINIINNSKDVIQEKKIADGFIQLNLLTTDKSVIFTLEDNGGGISNEILNKIFEPYYTTKHQSQGAGLGLYICYQIITKSYNGTIVAQNTPRGARFIITLPLNIQKKEEE